MSRRSVTSDEITYAGLTSSSQNRTVDGLAHVYVPSKILLILNEKQVVRFPSD